MLGYKPEVERCSACREGLDQSDLYFSDRLGGTICKKCSGQNIDTKKINSDVVKVLRLILKKEWQILSKLKIEAGSQKMFEKISDNYHSYILKRLKDLQLQVLQKQQAYQKLREHNFRSQMRAQVFRVPREQQ